MVPGRTSEIKQHFINMNEVTSFIHMAAVESGMFTIFSAVFWA